MTDEDRELMYEATGAAHAALSHGRMLLAMLIRSNVIQIDRATEYLDAAILAAEQGVGQPGATPDLSVRLRELSLTAELIAGLKKTIRKS